ncbi:transmembrane protein 109 isoform X1 [Alligator mississippiensis]|nr:transmembrane protein 109 isoform X1 [Alligator mississippiensis]
MREWPVEDPQLTREHAAGLLGVERRAGEMAGRDCRSWSCRQLLLRPAVALLMSAAFLHVASAQNRSGKLWKEAPVHTDFLSHLGQAMKETLEEMIGQEAVQMVAETISAMFWIVSNGISAGLIILSEIMGQILSAFGMNGDHVMQTLKLDPVHVQTLLLWGLAALFGYWLLSLVLGLVLNILGHIMTGVKVAFFLVCFIFIISSVPNPSLQALLLLALLTVYALLGRLTRTQHSGTQLEAKVHSLEQQVDELRHRQRQVSPRDLEQED